MSRSGIGPLPKVAAGTHHFLRKFAERTYEAQGKVFVASRAVFDVSNEPNSRPLPSCHCSTPQLDSFDFLEKLTKVYLRFAACIEILRQKSKRALRRAFLISRFLRQSTDRPDPT